MIISSWSRLLELILFQGGKRDAEIHALSLATLNDDDFISSTALFWTETGWVWALIATGWLWILAFIAVDLALYGMRWRLRRGLSPWGRRDRTSFPDVPAWINLALMAEISVETFTLCQVPSEQTTILGIMLSIGFCGYVCGLFAAFPILATINIVMLNLGLGIGLATGFSGNARPLAITSIGSAIAFCSLIRRTHASLLSALTAQQASRRISLHDPLTKLPNRAFMRERLTHCLSILRTQGGPTAIAVLCLDLDGFKEVNDRYGHAAGDWVLVHVAEVLRDSLQAGDFASRVGGDEYVVLLAKAGDTRVLSVADAIICAVGIPFDIGRVIPARIGVSIGAALAIDNTKNIDELLEEADMALYRAKQSGKNCLCLNETSPGGTAVAHSA